MEKKVKALINKLQAENDDRKNDLDYSSINDKFRRVLIHKHNYTSEIIQQLKNCL